MNQKLTPIILIAILGLAVGGFFIFKKPTPLENKQSESVKEEKQLPNEEQKEEKIQPFLDKNISMVCKYRVEEGLEFTTYIKGGMIKTVVPMPNDTNYSLFRDNKVYQWSEKQKIGFFMSIEDAQKQPGTEIKDPEKYVDEIMVKYKPDCKKTDLADSLFDIPKDIRFEDMSKLLNR